MMRKRIASKIKIATVEIDYADFVEHYKINKSVKCIDINTEVIDNDVKFFTWDNGNYSGLFSISVQDLLEDLGFDKDFYIDEVETSYTGVVVDIARN